jgi:hypothetical protein
MTFVSLGASGLAHSQCSSASMSSSRLFLGRLLSSRACFHFAGHERFSKTKPSRTMIFQRTATTPLTPCLSPRVHTRPSLRSIPFIFYCLAPSRVMITGSGVPSGSVSDFCTMRTSLEFLSNTIVVTEMRTNVPDS